MLVKSVLLSLSISIITTRQLKNRLGRPKQTAKPKTSDRAKREKKIYYCITKAKYENRIYKKHKIVIH